MRISRLFPLALPILFWCFASCSVFAADLSEVYKKALGSDPTFKAANAKWFADREILAISRAALLPQLTARGSVTKQRTSTESASGTSTFYDNTTGYSLQLQQSLFDFGNWAKVWGAKASVKQAEVTFLAAEEDLLLRVCSAYFNVLLAKDVLYYTRANKDALGLLLSQTKHKFEVGLVPIADLENTKANYDKANADEIAAVHDLDDKFEKLRAITGVKYSDLDLIRSDFPLVSPQPQDIEEWAKTAERQNFDIAAARYASIAARENIKVQNAGHMPTVTLNGGYSYDYDNNVNGASFSRGKGMSAGAQVLVPIFQGGGVTAATRQADYQYQQKMALLEQTRRDVVSQVRQTYLGVLSGISKIKADKQAIRSAQSSLRATRASYSAGTRTMTDVLTAQTQLYNAQKDFSKDEYEYINQTLLLKKLAGNLEPSALFKVNSWLAQPKQVAKSKSSVNKKQANQENAMGEENIKSLANDAKPLETRSEPKIQRQVLSDGGSLATNKDKIVVFESGEIEQVGDEAINSGYADTYESRQAQK